MQRSMNVKYFILIGLLGFSSSLFADKKTTVSVMTQNQYLGTSLTAIISADNDIERNLAVINMLISVQQNRTAERIAALAQSIAEREPHFAGLQEVEAIQCTNINPNFPQACAQFAGAFADHLQLTLDALANLGTTYNAVAMVENVKLEDIPVFLDNDTLPDIVISIIDRDVILVRDDVEDAAPAEFECILQSADGCNFMNTAIVGSFPVLRGYVGVDATIDGRRFRFVNTHLEIPFALTQPVDPNSVPVPVQRKQAEELIWALSHSEDDEDDIETILAGDFNSSPEDAYDYSPYKVISRAGYTDSWTRRPGKPSGYTCCQDSDLSNLESTLDTRIDHVFTASIPRRVKAKANVLDNQPEDKTVTGLWPSDHATVSVRLRY
ncbi:MAG: hypothetical protein HKN43_15890 [Rhodothermales bacterium]|nr:hypothetical protein [Rhodothermales bacterium]